MQFFNVIRECKEINVLMLMVVLDTIFGILRACKEHKLNSNIGIDGLIRKFGMMISVIFFMLIDYIMEYNLIGFIPEEIRTYLKLEKVGLSVLFLILFILYELLSVLKNMILCDLPIPKKLQKALLTLFTKYTDEIKESEGKENGDVKAE